MSCTEYRIAQAEIPISALPNLAPDWRLAWARAGGHIGAQAGVGLCDFGVSICQVRQRFPEGSRHLLVPLLGPSDLITQPRLRLQQFPVGLRERPLQIVER
jgi:hypothetical protein